MMRRRYGGRGGIRFKEHMKRGAQLMAPENAGVQCGFVAGMD